MGWTDKGNGNRTLATTIPKAGVNNYIYGDDAHTDAATSELAFAGIENGTNFQNTFEFEAPEWITGISAVENSNSIDNLKYYNLKFNVTPNGEGQPARSGNIVIKYHEQTLTLTVNQEAGSSHQTGYTLYIYDPSTLSTHFSHYRVNSGPNSGSVRTIPTGKTIEIYTYNPSTENNTIVVELLPKDKLIASRFAFITNTSSPDNNIVKYDNPVIDLDYANHGFSALSYSSQAGYGYATTNNNDSMWSSTVTADASTFILLSHMAPYPPINIFLSNKLYRDVIQFTLYYQITNSTDFAWTNIGLRISPLLIDLSLLSIYLDANDSLGGQMIQTILTAHLDEPFELIGGGTGEGKGYIDLDYEPGTGGGRAIDTVYVTLDGTYSYQWCLNNPSNPISITIR